jgi:hypothetical protein
MSEREDIEHLIRSVTAARNLLRQYVQPGPRSAVDTVDRLIDTWTTGILSPRLID